MEYFSNTVTVFCAHKKYTCNVILHLYNNFANFERRIFFIDIEDSITFQSMNNSIRNKSCSLW